MKKESAIVIVVVVCVGGIATSLRESGWAGERAGGRGCVTSHSLKHSSGQHALCHYPDARMHHGRCNGHEDNDL